jgi:hypothetical protein
MRAVRCCLFGVPLASELEIHGNKRGHRGLPSVLEIAATLFLLQALPRLQPKPHVAIETSSSHFGSG